MTLGQDVLREIAARYRDGEWADFTVAQAVFDIGRLLGHIADMGVHQRALERELAAAEWTVASLERLATESDV
jgi:hypothetical protein